MKFNYKSIGALFMVVLSILNIIIYSLVLNILILILGLVFGFISILLLFLYIKTLSTISTERKIDQYFSYSPQKEKKINIFLSYSTKDANRFNIQKLANRLQQFDKVDNVLYWKADSGENIVEYMERTLRKTDVFVPFFSENSRNSRSLEDEWHAAFQLRKKNLIKIIPISEKEENIPAILLPLQNIKHEKQDELEGLAEKIYKNSISRMESEETSERTNNNIEKVMFTSGYPSCVRPDIWYSLLVYLHLDRVKKEIQKIIEGKSSKLGQHPATVSIDMGITAERGAKFKLIPRMKGFIFNPKTIELEWYEDSHEIEFRLKTDNTFQNNFITGVIDVYLKELPVAQIPLSIKVGGCKEEKISVSKTKIYNKIFISYAHKDISIVEEAIKWYRVLGIKVLIDKSSLYSGHHWREDLRKLIEISDLFQLFWSTASKKSEMVEEEWRHALGLVGLKSEFFIRPFFWEEEMPEPPPELSHLHFEKLQIDKAKRF
jgi:hypothetical protein